MCDQSFKIEGVGQVSGYIVKSRPPAQQNPEQGKQQDGHWILLPVYIFDLKVIIALDKEVHEYRCNYEYIEQYDEPLKISWEAKLLHEPESELKSREISV